MVTPKSATVDCPSCSGKGSTFGYVEWSDGLGGTQLRCSLCDGTGRLAADPVTLATRYKEQLEALQNQHRRFVVATALYLKTARGELPDPPFVAAPAPRSDAAHWLTEICKEVKELPRLQRGSHAHGDEVCRANIEQYPTSYLDATCRAALGLPQLPARS